MRTRAPRGLVLFAVLVLLMTTSVGCSEGDGEPVSGSAAGSGDESEVAQVGGSSPAEAADLMLESAVAGDCTRVQEVAPGMFASSAECSEAIGELGDYETSGESQSGSAGLANLSLKGTPDQVELQLIAVDTDAGWLVVGRNGADVLLDEPAPAGIEGGPVDAVRAFVAGVRSGDCEDVLTAFPAGLLYCERDADELRDLTLESVDVPASDNPVVEAQILFSGTEKAPSPARLVRTVDDQWLIAAFLA